MKRIESELEKIFLYIGRKRDIDINTVQLVVGNLKVEGVFDLTSAIAWQFRVIWRVKALFDKKMSPRDISKKIGVFRDIDKYIEQGKNFSQQDLIYIFEKMLDADIELKSTGRPESLVMESLLIDLCIKK